MKDQLETYLNHHLAGSAGGRMLAKHLADTAPDDTERLFFLGLRDLIEGDRDVLEQVIREAGFTVGKIRQAVGSAVARAGIWKMDLNGTDIGDLGRFEMVELLSIGIHGKYLLWKTLREINGLHSEWNGRDFEALEKSALSQSADIEAYRAREALHLFRGFSKAGELPPQVGGSRKQ